MTFELRIRCDHEGCETSAVIEDEEAGPMLLKGFSDRRGGMFVLDSGWLDPPEGWDITKDGRELCPEHATEVSYA